MGLLNSLARQGRNGDTLVAHLTPGEVVIPKDVAALRPDLVAGVSNQTRAMGGNPNTLVAGRGKINPNTGLEEFWADWGAEGGPRFYDDATTPNPLAAGAASAGWGAYMNGATLSSLVPTASYSNAPLDVSAGSSWTGPSGNTVAAATMTPAAAPTVQTPAASGGTGSTSTTYDSNMPASYSNPTAGTDWNATIAQGYKDLFGRDAETAGANYWLANANAGKYSSKDDLYAAMKSNALNDDVLANKDGAQYATAWRSGLDPNKDALAYDASLDKWNPIKPKVTADATPSQYAYNFNSQVDAPTETIEGRIKNLLDQNNPVIRQAGERAMAQFAQRGLLNSSMAVEAANEAMVSKAIEIAGPDATKYFQNRRENVDWTNKAASAQQQQDYTQSNMNLQSTLGKDTFAANAEVTQKNTLQANYLQSVSNAEAQMKQFINTIQAADMPSEAKTSQIAQAQTLFDNTLGLLKAAYGNMPQWSNDWAQVRSIP